MHGESVVLRFPIFWMGGPCRRRATRLAAQALAVQVLKSSGGSNGFCG